MHCHATDLAWHTAAGGGRIASFSVIHRAPIAAFAGDTPYVPRCDPAQVRIGMPVRVCFESRPGSEQKIPQVEPA